MVCNLDPQDQDYTQVDQTKVQQARNILGLGHDSKLPCLTVDMPPGHPFLFSGESNVLSVPLLPKCLLQHAISRVDLNFLFPHVDPAGHLVHSGGHNPSLHETFCLHCYTNGMHGIVDPEKTIFPGPNAREICGITLQKGEELTSEEVEELLQEHLGVY